MLTERYDKIFNKLHQEISSTNYYSITFDLWTCSKNQNQFLAITCHFIDADFSLQVKCLGCVPAEGDHTGEAIASLIKDTLDKYGITIPQIVMAVTDSGTNVVKSCNILKIKRKACIAHTLNLCLQEILFPKEGKCLATELETLRVILNKCRSIASFFKKSPNSWHAYSEIYLKETGSSPNKIPRDCVTRWNSCLPMIQTIIDQLDQLQIAALKLKKVNLSVSPDDKEILQDLILILKPFQQATTTMSGSKYSTVSLIVPTLLGIRKALTKLTPQTIEGICVKEHIMNQMATRCTAIENDLDYQMSTFLDPRFKTRLFSDDQKETIIKNVVAILTEFEVRDDTIQENLEEKGRKPTMDIDIYQCSESESSTEDDESEFMRQLKREIKDYVNEKKSPFESDILEFWKTRKDSFPHLSKLVRKLLCIPATSVESERLFSKSGELINEKRSRLSSKNVEKIMFINRNM